MTKFAAAKLNGVTINLKQNEIKISATINLDEDSLALAQELEPFLGEDGGQVEILITPRQMQFKELEKTQSGDGSGHRKTTS